MRIKKQKKLAQIIATMYQSKLIEIKLSSWRGHQRVHVQLENLTPVERRAFMRAALVVQQLDADPKDYVMAQFKAWEMYSQYKNKFMLPSPGTLQTLGSQARYLAYLQQRERKLDPREAKMVTKKFFRDERKLKGLCQILRVPPEDVLTKQPEEFSEAFLKAKHVWPLVKETYRERSYADVR